MFNITYNGAKYECGEGETLLKALIRQRVKAPHSCGGGVCHVCMHRCTSGHIPHDANKNLREIYRKNNYFLLCKCIPESDMAVELTDKRFRFYRMHIQSVAQESQLITCSLQPFTDFRYKPHQFIKLMDGHGKMECCEIISDPELEECIRVVLPVSEEFGFSLQSLESINEVEVQGPFPEKFDVIEMAEGLKRNFPEPDLELWEALDHGRLLSSILKVFYERVFNDPLLGHFFTETTQQRLVEKQFNFMKQAITGEKIFFGERPRNSHHWMVISDELFDHREKIHTEVFREFGVSEEMIQRLTDIDEFYRHDIVKDKPWPKVLFGKVQPLDGFESLKLDEGTLCDGCKAELAAGTQIHYHVRTGKVYCGHCNTDNTRS